MTRRIPSRSDLARERRIGWILSVAGGILASFLLIFILFAGDSPDPMPRSAEHIRVNLVMDIPRPAETSPSSEPISNAGMHLVEPSAPSRELVRLTYVTANVKMRIVQAEKNAVESASEDLKRHAGGQQRMAAVIGRRSQD
jgi:hypothetical protein